MKTGMFYTDARVSWLCSWRILVSPRVEEVASADPAPPTEAKMVRKNVFAQAMWLAPVVGLLAMMDAPVVDVALTEVAAARAVPLERALDA